MSTAREMLTLSGRLRLNLLNQSADRARLCVYNLLAWNAFGKIQSILPMTSEAR